jgi:hypothetical protein
MQRLSPLLLLLLVVALVACGGTKTTTPPAGAGQGRVLASVAGGAATQRDPSDAPQGEPEPPPFAVVSGLVLEAVSYTPTTAGGFAFSGTVANRGQETLRPTRIRLDLLDASGQVAATTAFSSPTLPTLQPGETADWHGSIAFPTRPWQELRPTVEGTTAETGQ